MHLRRKETCGGCGTRRSEWDPAMGGGPGAYTAVRGHCPGCAEVERLRGQMKNTVHQIPGSYIALQRNEKG